MLKTSVFGLPWEMTFVPCLFCLCCNWKQGAESETHGTKTVCGSQQSGLSGLPLVLAVSSHHGPAAWCHPSLCLCYWKDVVVNTYCSYTHKLLLYYHVISLIPSQMKQNNPSTNNNIWLYWILKISYFILWMWNTMLLDTLWITVNLCNSTREAIHLHIMHLWRCEAEWKPFLCLIPYFPLGNLNKSHVAKPHFASPYSVGYFIMVCINSAYRRREKEEWRRETKKRERSTPANIATCWTSKAPALRLSGCGVHRMASCSTR